MFGIGFWEVVLILIISIIILNPNDYNKLFRTVVDTISDLKTHKKKMDNEILSSLEEKKETNKK